MSLLEKKCRNSLISGVKMIVLGETFHAKFKTRAHFIGILDEGV